jgi:hypothetical protein
LAALAAAAVNLTAAALLADVALATLLAGLVTRERLLLAARIALTWLVLLLLHSMASAEMSSPKKTQRTNEH